MAKKQAATKEKKYGCYVVALPHLPERVRPLEGTQELEVVLATSPQMATTRALARKTSPYGQRAGNPDRIRQAAGYINRHLGGVKHYAISMDNLPFLEDAKTGKKITDPNELARFGPEIKEAHEVEIAHRIMDARRARGEYVMTDPSCYLSDARLYLKAFKQGKGLIRQMQGSSPDRRRAG